jgi:hypothetical protein
LRNGAATRAGPDDHDIVVAIFDHGSIQSCGESGIVVTVPPRAAHPAALGL